MGATNDTTNALERICGTVIRLGDDINTDVIYPGAYLQISDPAEMAQHALEGMDSSFPGRIKRGNIIVAGKNFGCGSSREGAVTSLKHAGVATIISKTFARIFYRNMINQGFLPVECAEAVDAIKDGDEVCVDVNSGTIEVGGRTFSFQPPPPFILELLHVGGLINYTRRVVGGK